MSKREDIYNAALELFVEKGREATTIREITDRAGTARGTLYRYFDGKSDLARRLYERCARQMKKILFASSKAASGPSGRLGGLVRGVFDFYEAKPASCAYLLSVRKTQVIGNHDQNGHSPPIGLFVDVLEEGMRRGDFRKAPSPLVAEWFLALIGDTILRLKSGSVPLGKEEAVDRTVDAARRLLEPDPG